LGTVFHETGYQFRRFAGSYSDNALIFRRKMSSSKGTGYANPKLGVKPP
jgi:hypothetical protein